MKSGPRSAVSITIISPLHGFAAFYIFALLQSFVELGL